MGCNQKDFSVLLLVFTFGFSAAQWPRLENIPAPVQFQPNMPGQPSLPVDFGVPSQSLQRDPQSGGPVVASLGLQLQNPSDPQGQQVLQRPVKQLTWRFPAVPLIPTPAAPMHSVRQYDPVPAQGVAARCTETSVYVEVRRDLFSTDAPYSVDSLTLGGCAAKGMDASSQVLIYESPLHGCNSKLTVTANELVYVFYLGRTSAPLGGTPILRTAGARVFIQCRYPRYHNVSSNALRPAWLPFVSAQAAEERLVFSLRLMTGDWASESSSNEYNLGELINIEAAVWQFKHVPLRVLVDSCVATAVPDINAVPRYSFIENHGCLTDAKLTQSSSHFMPQTQVAKLGFQLEAFRFQQGNSSLVYIACLLKATAASAPPDTEHKACSFSDNRWIAAYGADQVCSCCSSSCAARKGRDLSSEQGFLQEERVHLGPIVVKENVW